MYLPIAFFSTGRKKWKKIKSFEIFDYVFCFPYSLIKNNFKFFFAISTFYRPFSRYSEYENKIEKLNNWKTLSEYRIYLIEVNLLKQ